MKIYTKKGDDGTTILGNNKVLRKDDFRIEVLGQFDELISFMGFVLLKLPKDDYMTDFLQQLLRTQGELISLCALLSFTSDELMITEKSLLILEEEIDNVSGILPKISQFTWQSNNELVAILQIVRTICRRVERSLVKLNAREKLPPIILAYINRLSDWFFIKILEANYVKSIE